MRLFSIFLLVSLISACADSHQLLRTGREVPKLEQSGVVYVSVPQDGRYGQTSYTGSGQNTTQIVLMAFSQYVKRVESGQDYQTLEAALEAARKSAPPISLFPQFSNGKTG